MIVLMAADKRVRSRMPRSILGRRFELTETWSDEKSIEGYVGATSSATTVSNIKPQVITKKRKRYSNKVFITTRKECIGAIVNKNQKKKKKTM